jgi:hypothetical protein
MITRTGTPMDTIILQTLVAVLGSIFVVALIACSGDS